MLVLPPAVLKTVTDAAEAAYPAECCGLLVGRLRADGAFVVREAVASRNLATELDRFEVDPGLRLRLQRTLRNEEGGGEDRVIGLYHSHPDQPAQPSRRDLDGAWETDLVWMIVAVHDGQAIQATAHVLDPQGCQFREIPLRTDDWHPNPSRPPLAS